MLDRPCPVETILPIITTMLGDVAVLVPVDGIIVSHLERIIKNMLPGRVPV